MTNIEDNYQIDEKFPYRFLLRWTWPEHIDRYIRRLMWAWLQEQGSNDIDDISSTDCVATHLFWLIAVSPETPGAVLDALSNTGSASFLERIAENKNTWASTLAKLALNDSTKVKVAVAENPNTPAATMLQLSLDENVDIRYAVADNCNQAVTILESLANDDNCHVAARSKRTLAQLNRVQPAVLKPATGSSTNKRKTAVGA
ncbi:MAG: hypothetical protein JST89_04740 [Cyanobacteria bacterium SZAS-4]|nr:hypothetical protein [Cyanobacteria bacterium SZAS-4]